MHDTSENPSCHFGRSSDADYYPLFNMQPYDEDLQDVPHICERVIYFLQTDDEEWELKREYQSDFDEKLESASEFQNQYPPFTMSGSERSDHGMSSGDDLGGMDEFGHSLRERSHSPEP